MVVDLFHIRPSSDHHSWKPHLKMALRNVPASAVILEGRPSGVCRIAAPSTHELALTLPRWRELLRPIAAKLAQMFREALAGKSVSPRSRLANAKNVRPVIPASKRSPLIATPRKASQRRPYTTRTWQTPTVEARPATPIACAMCGSQSARSAGRCG
jgi:hypothetical protein